MISNVAGDRLYKQINERLTEAYEHIHSTGNWIDDRYTNSAEQKLKFITKRRHAKLVTSGTSAIQTALMAWDLVDKNIACTNYSYVASANQAAFLNDVDFFDVGDDVVISGLVSYGMNITGKKGKHCPYWNGKFEPNMKKPFMAYLTRELGVDVKDIYVSRLPNSCRENKVQINNLLTLIILGKVIEPDMTSSLSYRSVGQRKSYGFGNLNCDHEVASGLPNACGFEG